MAKTNWSITSGFIGKLGNVVGFNWKGINVMRAHTQNGLFVKENMCYVLGDSLESLTLDYEHLQLTSGKLNGVEFGEATLNGDTLSVTIADDNFTGRRVSAADLVYLVAYCPELRDAKCAMVGTRTTASALTLSLPAKWNGKTVYAYGFTLGAASFNDGLASATSFLGSFGSTESSSSGSSGSNSGTSETPGTSGTSETPTVAAPVISGTTPFEESTEVTITGPAGAEIRYTTDGSTPTAESTLYSEPFTLTESANVRAIAIKDGVSSTVSSKQFTKGLVDGEK